MKDNSVFHSEISDKVIFLMFFGNVSTGAFLLKEDGGYLLQENGGKILIES